MHLIIIQHIVYNVLLADANNDKVNWVSLLRNLLETCGFGDAWQNQGVENDIMFLRLVKERLRDNFGQTIQRELRDTSRGKNYVLYHEHFFKRQVFEILLKLSITE